MRARVADNVIFESLGDQLVLLNLDTSHYFNLKGSGPRVWELIQEHGNLDRVLSAMASEYRMEAGALEGDLHELVRDLEARGLIVVDRQPTP